MEASNSIRIQTGAKVTGGDVGTITASGPFLGDGVSADVLTGAQVQSTHNLISGSVNLATGASVGDVQTSQLTAAQGSTHGSVSPYVPLPPLPVAGSVTPGTANLAIAAGATVIAAAFAYAEVSVGTGATWRLPAGTYQLNDLTLVSGARIEAAGSVQIRIAGRLTAAAGAFVGAKAGVSLTAKDIRIEVSGRNGTSGGLSDSPKAVAFTAGGSITALLLVPNGTLQLGTGMTVAGALMAKDIDVATGTSVGFQDGFPVSCTPASCDDGNPCTADACSSTGCTHVPSAAGTSCSDGNACNGLEICDGAGTCKPGNAVKCTAQDQCHGVGACNPSTGVCSNPTLDGTSCDDGNGCTLDDTCRAGVCTGGQSCAAEATCAGTGTSATCACGPGFTGDGFTCSDIDECALGTAGCSPFAICANTPGSFTCTCAAGYAGDGFTCTTDVTTVVAAASGGTVAVSDSHSPLYGASISLPPQSAAGGNFNIAISAPTSVSVPPPVDVVGPIIHLEPHGVVFDPPAQLVLPYDRSMVPVADAPRLSVLALDDPETGWQQVPPISVDSTAGTVTVLAHQLSDWVVFDPGDAPPCPTTTCHPATLVFDGSWSCVGTAAADGTTCDDGSGCTVGDACASGVCVAGAGCGTNALCEGTGESAACQCSPGYLGDGRTCNLDTHFNLYTTLTNVTETAVFRLIPGQPSVRVGVFGDMTSWWPTAVMSPDGLTMYAAGLGPTGVVNMYTLDLTTGLSTEVALENQALSVVTVGVMNGQVICERINQSPLFGYYAAIDPNTGSERFLLQTNPLVESVSEVLDPLGGLLYELDVGASGGLSHSLTVSDLASGTARDINIVLPPTVQGLMPAGLTTSGQLVITYEDTSRPGVWIAATADPVSGVATEQGFVGLAGLIGSPVFDPNSETVYLQDGFTGVVQWVNVANGATGTFGSLDYPKEMVLARTTINCSGDCLSRPVGHVEPCSIPNTVCDEFATCTSSGGGTYSCSCNAGTTGDGRVCAITDVCADNNGGCAANASCTTTAPLVASCTCGANSTGDGITCPCDDGYALTTRVGTLACSAIDACQTNNGGCNQFASCADTGPGTRTCTCRSPYVGDGMTCTCGPGYTTNDDSSCSPINLCLTTSNGGCDPQARCTFTGPNQRTCTCPAPLVGDGLTCINLCQTPPNGGCDPHALCSVASGATQPTCRCKLPFEGDGLTCACPDGYAPSGNDCLPIDACQATTNGGCAPLATCQDTGPGQRSCACPSGTTGDGFTCTPTLGFELVGAIVDGTSDPVFAIDPVSGSATARGSLLPLQSAWPGQWMWDLAGTNAYVVGPSSGTQTSFFMYNFASGTSTTSPPLTDILPTFVIGVTFGGHLVTLYQADTQQVVTFDPVTGAQLGIIDLGVLSGTGDANAAFDAGRNTLFLMANDTVTTQDWLYTVNLTTGTSTRIAVPYFYSFASVNAAGNLVAAWGGSDGGTNVGELDPRTGNITPIGQLGFSGGFDGEMVYDPTTNRLYAHGDDGDGVIRIRTLALDTGVATSVVDGSSDPIDLIYARTTGACLGSGCGN